MSFALQGGQIRAVLVSHGFPADLASQLANILANGAQQMRRSGEQVTDKTRPGLRMVAPDDRKHQFRNLDFREGDPDHRRQRVRDSEERASPIPPATVINEIAPQETDVAFNVAGGAYTEAVAAGESVRVGLRIAGGGRMPVLDQPSNTIVGKTFRAATNSDEFRLSVRETDDEVLWNLQAFLPRKKVRVVTGLQWAAGKGLEVLSRDVWVFDVDKTTYKSLVPATARNVATDVRDTGDDIIVDKARVYVFESEGRPSSAIETSECPT